VLLEDCFDEGSLAHCCWFVSLLLDSCKKCTRQ
jgi:hypothetical protein